MYVIGHADVTLIPGALSHIRHMTRDDARKAIIWNPFEHLASCVGDIWWRINVSEMSVVIQFTLHFNTLHFIILTKAMPLCVCVCLRVLIAVFFVVFFL